MQVTKEQIEPCTISLKIEIEAEGVAQAFSRAYKEFGKTTSVPGFRPGKAPRAMLEKYVNQERLNERVQEMLASKAYREAIEENNIEPNDEPQVEMEELTDGQPWQFTARVPLEPVITLGDVSAISVTRPVYEVRDEDVEKRLMDIRENYARLEKVEDRSVEAGDVLIAEIKVQLEGEEEEPDFKRTLIRLGDNIPGFDENIIGMNAEEERTFELEYPADFDDEARAGKKAAFTIKVMSINKHVLPELTDEWIEQTTMFKSVEEMTKFLRDDQQAQANTTSANITESKIIEKLVGTSTLEFSSMMVDDQLENEMHNLMHYLEDQKKTYEEYLEMVHKTQEQFLEEMRATATNQVKTILVMRELVKAENIEVSEEAIREEMVRYAIENRISEQDLQNQIKERAFVNEMANKVILKKIREFLFSKAQIEDEPVVD